jgi:hypothetical protein
VDLLKQQGMSQEAVKSAKSRQALEELKQATVSCAYHAWSLLRPRFDAATTTLN